VSRHVLRAGGFLIAGAAVLFSATSTRADDSCFAFFRRCPPESGAQTPAATDALQLCRPPRCPPYYDPNFGFYGTAWRSWPTTYTAAADELPTAPTPRVLPGTPGGGKPAIMPPAAPDGEARRLPATQDLYLPAVRPGGDLPALSGASVR
jgi:hypothetical protein